MSVNNNNLKSNIIGTPKQSQGITPKTTPEKNNNNSNYGGGSSEDRVGQYLSANDVNQCSLGKIGFFQSHGNFDSFHTCVPESPQQQTQQQQSLPPTIVTSTSSATFERIFVSGDHSGNNNNNINNNKQLASTVSESPVPTYIALPNALLASPNNSPSRVGDLLQNSQLHYQHQHQQQISTILKSTTPIPHTNSTNSNSNNVGGSAYRLHAAKALHKVNATILRAEQQLLTAIGEGNTNLSSKTNPSSNTLSSNNNNNNNTFVDVIHGMINDPSCSSTEVARAICNVLGLSQMITSTTPFLAPTTSAAAMRMSSANCINSNGGAVTSNVDQYEENKNNNNIKTQSAKTGKGAVKEDSPTPEVISKKTETNRSTPESARSPNLLLDIQSGGNSQANALESGNENNNDAHTISSAANQGGFNFSSNSTASFNSSFAPPPPGSNHARRATVAGHNHALGRENTSNDDGQQHEEQEEEGETEIVEVNVDDHSSTSPSRPTTASFPNSNNNNNHYRRQSAATAIAFDGTGTAHTNNSISNQKPDHEESFLRNIQDLVSCQNNSSNTNNFGATTRTTTSTTASPTAKNQENMNNLHKTMSSDDSNNNTTTSNLIASLGGGGNASPVPFNPTSSSLNNENTKNIGHNNNNNVAFLTTEMNNNSFQGNNQNKFTREPSANGNMMSRNSSLLLLQQKQQEQEENLRKEQFECLIKVMSSMLQIFKSVNHHNNNFPSQHSNNSSNNNSQNQQYYYTNASGNNNNNNNNGTDASGSGSLSASLAGKNNNDRNKNNTSPPSQMNQNDVQKSTSAPFFNRHQSAIGQRPHQLSFYNANINHNNTNNNTTLLNSRQPSTSLQNFLFSNTNANNPFSSANTSGYRNNTLSSSSRQPSMYNPNNNNNNNNNNNQHHHPLAARLLSQHVSMNARGTSFAMDTSIRSVSRAEVMQTKNVVDTMDEVGMRYVNQYMLLESRGKGCQGEVFCALDTCSNEYRAIKVMSRGLFSSGGGGGENDLLLGGSSSSSGGASQTIRNLLEASEVAKQIRNEIKILQKCRHPNIVALFEVIDDPSRDDIYLVMQYVEHGALFRCDPSGRSSQTYTVEKFLHYARQLSSGLCYLHEHNIAHRDIKPENILRGSLDVVCLADFGISDTFSAASNAVAVSLLERTANNMRSGEFVNNNNDMNGNDASLSGSSGAASGTFDPFLGSMTAEERKLLQTRIATVYGIGKRCGTTAFLPPEMLSSDISHHGGVAAEGVSLSRQASLAPGLSAVYENPVAYTEEELQAADVWALGLVFYCMLYGSLPFDSSDCWTYIEDIVNSPFEIPKMTSPVVLVGNDDYSNEDQDINTLNGENNNGQLHHLHVIGEEDDDYDLDGEGKKRNKQQGRKQEQSKNNPEIVPRQIRIILSRMLHRDRKERAKITEIRTAFKEVTASLNAKQQQMHQQQQQLTRSSTVVIVNASHANNNNNNQQPQSQQALDSVPRVTSNNNISKNQQQEEENKNIDEKNNHHHHRQQNNNHASSVVTFLSPHPPTPLQPPAPNSNNNHNDASPATSLQTTCSSSPSSDREGDDNNADVRAASPPSSSSKESNQSSSNPRHKNQQRKATMVPSESSLIGSSLLE